MTDTTRVSVSTRTAVVLTAIQPETEAVLRHLEVQHPERVVDTWFHIGRIGSWMIAVAEAGSGNAPAATIAVRAFTHYKPEIAAFVGVAGGLKDVALGDLVVATKVYGYEAGKETPDGFRTRPDVQNSHHELQQRARTIRIRSPWYDRLDPILWSNRRPKVHVGPIAAGEAVVADNVGRIASHLKLNYSDVLAVEMEGRGFLEAAHTDPGCRAVVVRGISDLLAGKARADKLGWQRRAADAAATFFFAMLAFGDGSETGQPHPVSTNPDTNLSRSRESVKKAVGHITVPLNVGRELNRAMTIAMNDSRHLVVEYDHGIIGVIIHPDEFNLLMKLSSILSDPSSLSQGSSADDHKITIDDMLKFLSADTAS